MEKSKKIGAQIYGYIICVVAVITFLICTTTMINAIMNLSDPIHSGWNPAGTPSLASYEIYKMDVLKTTKNENTTTQTSFVPDEPTLRAMYDAAKADKIQSVKHESNRDIIVSCILILICITLFTTHWRWMRKISKSVD
jgi:hypothetical protein